LIFVSINFKLIYLTLNFIILFKEHQYYIIILKTYLKIQFIGHLYFYLDVEYFNLIVFDRAFISLLIILDH
jgi:hypothetical protein